MPLNSIHNGRGFFSDYWLGSLQSGRKTEGPKLTPAQARKSLFRLSQLRERVDTVEPPDLTTFREKYVRPLFLEILGFTILENGDEPRLRLLAGPAVAKPLAAVLLLPDHNEIEARGTRSKIDKALLDHDLGYGFIATPTTLRLVRRPGDGNKNAYLDFSIATAVESEDADSLSVAYRILSAESLAPGSDGHAAIERLEAESRKQSQQVSEDLKEAVFSSAELLIRGFLDDVRLRADAFTPPPPLLDLRDTALLTLYRLLFVLYAESRDERLQTHVLYVQAYSLEQMIDRLLKTHHNEFAGNRYGLWQQLLVLFKIYDQGLPPLPGLQNIPPRGGTLFSEKTKEGQLLARFLMPDSVVARLLLGLATTRPRRGVGRERVSFRELEIQQLGAVYEGLLEYEPRVADGTMIESKVLGKEYVLAPAEFRRLCEQKDLVVKGDFAIVEGTDAASLHPSSAEDDDDEGDDEQEGDEDGDEDDADEEDKGVRKGAPAKLIRRLENGDFYFVPGSSRKASGSFYTREEIVNYLVRHALQDLVDGKSAAEIESLRVMDDACGSAHFLVGAARYLGKRLLDAYKRELKGDPPPDFHPNRDLTAQVRDEWEKQGEAWCKRRIVERCLFGVDLNPTAVQLAQVALWIESLAGDRPLSFFDHHIRCGNSLMGTWLARLQKPLLGEEEENEAQFELLTHDVDEQIAKALDERLLIDCRLPTTVRKDTPAEYEYKQDRLTKARSLSEQARLLFDLRCASAFVPAIRKQWWSLLRTPDLKTHVEKQVWYKDFCAIRVRERFFHWELEFPEVFRGQRKGFDCVLGNPPWEKIKPDRMEYYGASDVLIRAYTGGELDVRIKELHRANPGLEDGYEAYSERIKTIAACVKKGGDFKFCDWVVEGKSTGGDPDLFKFFVEQGHRILRSGGRLGYLVPSGVYNNEGATGLRYLILDQCTIRAFYGFENRYKLFPIDSRLKFVCLVLEKRKDDRAFNAEFPATFMRHDLEELESGPPAGVQVVIKRTELEGLSPGTLAFLEYRSERDREVILKMYGLLPGMTPRPLLGDQGRGTWNAKFYSEFHMTNDRDLWTKPDGTLWTPKGVLGRECDDFLETRSKMEGKGFWPLYQDAHIHQYVLEFKPLMRWVCLEAYDRKYKGLPSADAKLVLRDPARSTDERTCIAALLPPKSCFGHTLNGVRMEDGLKETALAMFNSLCFDYLMRKRVGGQHVSPYLLERAAVVPPSQLVGKLRAVPAIHANQTKTWVYDKEACWEPLTTTEKTIAIAYGLGGSELMLMLQDFPGFTRKRAGFLAYLQEQMKGWRRR
jgi:hypothetical protein